MNLLYLHVFCAVNQGHVHEHDIKLISMFIYILPLGSQISRAMRDYRHGLNEPHIIFFLLKMSTDVCLSQQILL